MLTLNHILILIFLSLKVSLILSKKCKSIHRFDDAQIIIRRSAEIDSNLNRGISIYWYNKNFIEGDILALYNKNPKKKNATIIFEYKPNIYRGNIKTPIKISLLKNYVFETNKDICLEYFAAWVRNNQPKKITCLTTHRNWMYKMKNLIGTYRLNDIILPGSYKSGSYIKNLPLKESYIEKATVTQNQDIYTQLIYGVRYIDIQPGYYPNDSIKYWSNEKCLKQMPLLRIILDIKLFLQATKEIIILTFRNFSEGFNNNNDYDNFKNFLEEQFNRDIIHEMSINLWNMTLNEIWESNKRLIINFDYSIESKINSLQFKPQYEGLESEDSYEVIREIINSEYNAKYKSILQTERIHYNIPRIVIAAVKSNYIPECYINTTKINSTNYQTTRRFADIISPVLLQIYNENYFDSANIIVVNFVDTVGIVDFAIEWNRRRTSLCYNYYKSLMNSNSIYYF